MEAFKNAIKAHCQKYPDLEIQDLFKFLHQSAFGCEHLVSSPEASCDYILSEYKGCAKKGALIEPLGGEFSRVNLAYLDTGLSAFTLSWLFYLSSREEKRDESNFNNMLLALKELACSKEIPFSWDELEEKLSWWAEKGYQPLHHSDKFREKYSPAYRVISNKYVKYLELFAKIDKMSKSGQVILAIDGRCASGKTTLAGILKEVYDLNLFHMDDFFLRPEQRTRERFLEIGGNIDHERFKSEVLEMLVSGKPFSYFKFECSKMSLSNEPTLVMPKSINLIEGVYSMHPLLFPFYNLTVLLDVDQDTQRERLLKRNPQMAERFFSEFIPLEEKYFLASDLKSKTDLYFLN